VGSVASGVGSDWFRVIARSSVGERWVGSGVGQAAAEGAGNSSVLHGVREFEFVVQR